MAWKDETKMVDLVGDGDVLLPRSALSSDVVAKHEVRLNGKVRIGKLAVGSLPCK